MKAMVFEGAGRPLVYKTLPDPEPAATQVLIKIMACGICRTDLHIIDGELKSPKLPLIPGHEIIGKVVAVGNKVENVKAGDRVGVPWLGYTCGKCRYCLMGKENLCENALFTGYTIDGGYAEYTVADARFVFLLPDKLNNAEAAPLMCAGLIGFRSYRMINSAAKNIGIYGFGAAAHIITQIAVAQGKNIFAFTRDGDESGQQFALKMGACWAGGSGESATEKLDAAIILAPVGALVPKALKDVDKASPVICGGIHMSDIPSFTYDLLWEERSIQSVANLTRNDGIEFFEVLKSIPVKTQIETFKLDEANEALYKLKTGKIKGAAVLAMDQ